MIYHLHNTDIGAYSAAGASIKLIKVSQELINYYTIYSHWEYFK